MSLSSLSARRPLLTLLTLSLFICGSAAVAGTGVVWTIADQAPASVSNPHRIPDEMDPKSLALAQEIKQIKYEIQEASTEEAPTIHSVAFQDYHGKAQPTLDYTTGTSN